MSDDPTRPPDDPPRPPGDWAPVPPGSAPRPPDGWVPPAPPPPRGGWAPTGAGDPQPFAASYVPPPGYSYGPTFAQPTYQPGLGKLSVLPPQASGWNWGAFFFSWIWGLFNGAYVTLWGLLLWFVPSGALVWAIVCGVNGNRWAWQGRDWSSVEHFRAVQRTWAIAALVVFLVAVVAPLVLILVLLVAGSGSGTSR
jgi:hypothetical protein